MNKKSVDIVDAVNCIYPQLNFLADVLCFSSNTAVIGDGAGGLSSILTSISRQLQDAVREVSDGDT